MNIFRKLRLALKSRMASSEAPNESDLIHIREDFANHLYKLNNRKADFQELRSGAWPKIWVRVGEKRLGILDDVAIHGTDLYVGHFSTVSPSVQRKGIGRAMVAGLSAMMRGWGVRRIFITIRPSEKIGAHLRFWRRKTVAKRIKKPNGKLTLSYVLDLNLDYQKQLLAFASNPAPLYEALLAYECIVVALLDGPHGQRAAGRAEYALERYSARIRSVEGVDVDEQIRIVDLATLSLSRLKKSLKVRMAAGGPDEVFDDDDS